MALHASSRDFGYQRSVRNTLIPLLKVPHIMYRLDAVDDLIDHPTFEAEFTDVAKGLPDLERIVSRIHARNCRVKDFLKVLEVRMISLE